MTDKDLEEAKQILDGIADSEYVICGENVNMIAQDISRIRTEAKAEAESDRIAIATEYERRIEEMRSKLSEARAEALKEAAERLERWCDDFDVPYFADISSVLYSDYGHRAIFTDEPKKVESMSANTPEEFDKVLATFAEGYGLTSVELVIILSGINRLRGVIPEPRMCETCANNNSDCVLEPCASCCQDTRYSAWTKK